MAAEQEGNGKGMGEEWERDGKGMAVYEANGVLLTPVSFDLCTVIVYCHYSNLTAFPLDRIFCSLRTEVVDSCKQQSSV